jgi:hypothetical protein
LNNPNRDSPKGEGITMGEISKDAKMTSEMMTSLASEQFTSSFYVSTEKER